MTVMSEPFRPTASVPDPLRDLARGVVEGDPRAPERILREVAPSILATLRAVLGPAHPNLDDVLQDSLLGFVKALPAFRGESSVLHFARRVAVRRALEYRRNALAVDRTRERAAEATVDETPPTPHDDAIRRRRREELRQLVCDLPHEQAETVILNIVLGYTSEEIAELAGVSANTVRSRIRLGLRALRRRIDADERRAELLELGR
jgi:RNA polymerase sigma-70 factor (ECF subfamily)